MACLARSPGGLSAHRLPLTAYFDPGSHFPGRHKRRAYYYVRRYWGVLRGKFPFLRPESPLNQQSL
ncbi:hypothetical protein M405DRAFT_831660 [Rhizopogon salebrosus TDB-379]|nr:hypothetical protein M405DRAFT_831660 [Rhizopogon salebrosus TDB-379]